MRRMELILLKQYRWWAVRAGESVEVVVVAKPSNRVEEILSSLPSIYDGCRFLSRSNALLTSLVSFLSLI